MDKKLTLLLFCTVFFSGCSLMKVGPMPTPPAPPVAPNEVAFNDVEKPALPEKNIQEDLESKYKDTYLFDMTPGKFPVKSHELMVVAVPKDAAKVNNKDTSKDDKHGTVSTSEKDMRISILAGFLNGGYRVKDAGVLNTVTFSMRRYPASDEKTVTKKKKEFSDDESVVVTSTRKPGEDYWWYNKGLTLNMNDPTSLWAPELLSYSSLEANYFMRIFEFEFGESLTDIVLQNKYDSVQRSKYIKQVELANQQIKERNRKLRKYLEELDRYDNNYAQYEKDYKQYAKEFKSWQKPFYFVERAGKLDRKESKRYIPRPRILENYNTSQIDNVISRSEKVPEEWVRFSAEIVDVKTGNVVWVGSKIFAKTRKSFDSKSRLMSGIASKLSQF